MEEKEKIVNYHFKDLDSFKEAVSKAPSKSMVLSRSLGGGKSSKYVPLFVQQAIADLFFRECDVISEDYQVVVNEIVCVVKLSLLPDYPDAEHRYITGVGAKPIQMESGSSASKFPLGKKTNALEYNTPAAKSAAISNALTTFGNIFGRNLNREVRDDYSIKPKKEEENES